MSFGNVADPRGVQSLINGRLREEGGRAATDRDAEAVLDEILDELRAIRRAVETAPGDARPASAPGGGSSVREDADEGA